MVYFLSDAHLGSRVMSDPLQHQQRLVRLLESMSEDATQIFLLGDIFDYWCEYYQGTRYAMDDPRSPKYAYLPILNTLRALTHRGIQVHFFIGNHDIWTFGWLERETGVRVYRRPQTMCVNGKTLFLAHGDGLVPSDFMTRIPRQLRGKIRSFMLLRSLFHNPVAQFFLRILPVRWGDELGYEWARHSREKEMANPCLYKGEDQEEQILFAKEQERLGNHHDYYIFGHRHIELNLMISRDSQVIILGDCFRQWTYGQMDADGQFTMCQYEQ